jgi:hypothetical protein
MIYLIKEYALDVDDLRRNNRFIEEAKLMLQKHDSRHQVLHMSEKSKEKGNKKIQFNSMMKQIKDLDSIIRSSLR